MFHRGHFGMNTTVFECVFRLALLYKGVGQPITT